MHAYLVFCFFQNKHYRFQWHAKTLIFFRVHAGIVVYMYTCMNDCLCCLKDVPTIRCCFSSNWNMEWSPAIVAFLSYYYIIILLDFLIISKCVPNHSKSISNDIIRFSPFCSNENMRSSYILIISSESNKDPDPDIGNYVLE